MFPHAAADHATTLVIHGEQGYELQNRAGMLAITRNHQTTQLIPTRRVARVIYRNAQNPHLATLVDMVTRGITVHFQNGLGDLTATLVPTQADASPETRAFVAEIEGRSIRCHYREWLSLQLKHHASLILRRAPSGAISHFEYLLQRYASKGTDPNRFGQHWSELQGLLHAHVDGYFTRYRLRSLIDTLHRQNHRLIHDLDRILAIPLLWQLSPWLRQNPKATPRQLMGFFEQQRDALDGALHKATSALYYHLKPRPRPTVAART